MSVKKQNFAAAAFLSTAEKPAKQEATPKSTAQKQTTETKSRRLQLLLKPSDYEKLRRMADRQQCSVNRAIELLIADAEE